jgi:hypothetical protein
LYESKANAETKAACPQWIFWIIFKIKYKQIKLYIIKQNNNE